MARSKANIHVMSAVAVALCIGCLQTADASSSGGIGGLYEWQTNKSFNNGTYTSKYHIDASGIDRSKPVGIVIHLHGDGAYGFNNPNSSYALGGNEGIRAVARRHNMITLSVLTPDRDTGDYTWWWQGVGYAKYIHDLIDHIYGKYNIDKTRVWFVGYSGGAQFITQYYLPEYAGSGQVETGGALMFGGGDNPLTGDPERGVVNGIPTDFKQRFRMYWGAGTADGPDGSGWYGGYAAAKSGVDWYRNRGFTNLHTHYPQGWCHETTNACDSFEEKFGHYLNEQLEASDPTSPTDSSDPFTYSYDASKYGITMYVHAGAGVSTVQLRASRYPLSDPRSKHSYNYEYDDPDSQGNVTLRIKNELKRNTMYHFNILFDDVIVETGTFWTK